MIKIKLKDDFDLGKIVRFRPFLFFAQDVPERVMLLDSGPARLSFSQERADGVQSGGRRAGGGTLLVSADRELEKAEERALSEKLSFCLGAQEDLSAFYSMAREDPVLSRFRKEIQGNRLLSAPTDFEALASIICSQNVSFGQYKRMTQRVIAAYGFFPLCLDVLGRPELLGSCGLGYRKQYVLNAAKFFSGGGDSSGIIGIKGVGKYSRDIFELFQKRNYSSFYFDSLILKIIREEYGEKVETESEARDFAGKQWGGYAGLAEVCLQKFLRDNKKV